MTIQQCKYILAIARLGSMNEAAKALLPYVTNVHVCHWIKLDKKPLSEGLEDWREYVDILKTDDDRIFMLEFMHDGEPSSLPATAKTLHELIGE